MSRAAAGGLSPRTLGIAGAVMIALGLAGYGARAALRVGEMRQQIDVMERDLVTLRARADELGKTVERLRSDPAYIEKLAREEVTIVVSNKGELEHTFTSDVLGCSTGFLTGSTKATRFGLVWVMPKMLRLKHPQEMLSPRNQAWPVASKKRTKRLVVKMRAVSGQIFAKSRRPQSSSSQGNTTATN